MSPSAPSLFAESPTQQPKTEVKRAKSNLVDLMHDGFYLLFLLRNRVAPYDAKVFRERIQVFLSDFEREAKKYNASTDDVFDAKYAFCAAVDEVILSSHFEIRDEWERQPLQLMLFGEHLAGERYFDKLEELRAKGAPRVQALEVFYHCLLHGFRGKYLLEGPEKLNYLIARVGDEVAHHKGKRAAFAPNWAIPDRIKHALNNEIPIWVIASVMAMMAILGFVGLNSYLGHQTNHMLAGYNEIFKAAPRPAHVNITLP